MDLAIQFDPEAFRRAVEIKNVFSNAVLATEFSAVKVGVFDEIPEGGLGRC